MRLLRFAHVCQAAALAKRSLTRVVAGAPLYSVRVLSYAAQGGYGPVETHKRPLCALVSPLRKGALYVLFYT